MHEYSITSSIIKILKDVIKDEKIKTIKKINFDISPIANIEKESIRFYFDFLTQNEPAFKKCQLLFNKGKIIIECMDCGSINEIKNLKLICPYCNGKKIKVLPSDDIKIISIET